MKVIKASTLTKAQSQRQTAYDYLLDNDAFEVGLYKLAAGGLDKQNPHKFPEVYFVIEGAANFETEGHETASISRGDLIYVDAHKTHRFCDISADLTLLVFFAKVE